MQVPVRDMQSANSLSRGRSACKERPVGVVGPRDVQTRIGGRPKECEERGKRVSLIEVCRERKELISRAVVIDLLCSSTMGPFARATRSQSDEKAQQFTGDYRLDPMP